VIYTFVVHDEDMTTCSRPLALVARVLRDPRALGFTAVVLLLLSWFAWFVPASAPAVTFQTITGEAIAMRDLHGKVVLLNFWATDCVICLKEMPDIARTHQKFRAQGYETIAVAMKYDPPNRVLAYAEGNRLPFKVAIDVHGDVARRFGDIRVTPTTFIIDRRGRIVKQYLGELDFARLHALVADKLREPL
jgi:peroxiredoxin